MKAAKENMEMGQQGKRKVGKGRTKRGIGEMEGTGGEGDGAEGKRKKGVGRKNM